MSNKLPSFASPVVWDNQTSYEALKIVIYDGHAYTSKQAVPAGTQLSNTNYWYPTGNIYKVLNELSSSLTQKSESVPTQYSDENIVFIKSGNCCQIYINGIKNIPANGGTELCTIPVGYYPMFQDLIKWGLYDTSMTPIVRFYTNATRNKLFIYNYTSGSLTKANFHVNINYITKD